MVASPLRRAAPLGEVLHQLLALVGDLGQDLRDLLGVAPGRFLLLGHRAFLYAFSALVVASRQKDRSVIVMSDVRHGTSQASDMGPDQPPRDRSSAGQRRSAGSCRRSGAAGQPPAARSPVGASGRALPRLGARRWRALSHWRLAKCLTAVDRRASGRASGWTSRRRDGDAADAYPSLHTVPPRAAAELHRAAAAARSSTVWSPTARMPATPIRWCAIAPARAACRRRRRRRARWPRSRPRA